MTKMITIENSMIKIDDNCRNCLLGTGIVVANCSHVDGSLGQIWSVSHFLFALLSYLESEHFLFLITSFLTFQQSHLNKIWHPLLRLLDPAFVNSSFVSLSLSRSSLSLSHKKHGIFTVRLWGLTRQGPRFSIRMVIGIFCPDTETGAVTPPGVMQKK